MTVRMIAVPVDEEALKHRVDKYLYTVRDAEWALGGIKIVRALRAARWLEPVAGIRPIVFTARSVADAAARLEREGLPE